MSSLKLDDSKNLAKYGGKVWDFSFARQGRGEGGRGLSKCPIIILNKGTIANVQEVNEIRKGNLHFSVVFFAGSLNASVHKKV